MHYYFKIAKIGFIITAEIGFCFVIVACLFIPAPQRLLPLATYFIMSGGYVVCLPSILHDMLMKERIWVDPRRRCFGVPLIGASIGLFLLGWAAIVEPTGLVEWRMTQHNLLERGLVNFGTQEYQLIYQAEFLATCKLFVDNWVKYASACAAISVLGVWLYDKIKPCWSTVSFYMGLLLPLPLIIPFLFDQNTGRLTTFVAIAFLVQTWLVTGSILGAIFTAVVWTVRSGWWQPVQTTEVTFDSRIRRSN